MARTKTGRTAASLLLARPPPLRFNFSIFSDFLLEVPIAQPAVLLPECPLCLAFDPQVVRSRLLLLWTALFWPVIFTVAALLLPQRGSLLIRSPLRPPVRLRTSLEIGASGTLLNVVRRRPWTLSTFAATSTSTCPLRSRTMFGSRVSEERR